MKNIALRTIFGFCAGISISQAIALYISYCIGDGNFYPVTPALLHMTGTALSATLLQTICLGLIGAIFCNSHFIFSQEEWSLLKRSIIHFLVSISSLGLIGYMLGWVGTSIISILCFFGIFFLIYLIVWIIAWRIAVRDIEKINEKLA